MSDIEVALAASLFAEGFRVGSGPRFLKMSQRERELQRGQNEHFVAGLKAGRDAARKARDEYRARLVLGFESSTSSR